MWTISAQKYYRELRFFFWSYRVGISLSAQYNIVSERHADSRRDDGLQRFSTVSGARVVVHGGQRWSCSIFFSRRDAYVRLSGQTVHPINAHTRTHTIDAAWRCRGPANNSCTAVRVLYRYDARSYARIQPSWILVPWRYIIIIYCVYTIIPSGATTTVVAPSCIYYPQDPVSKNFIISNSLNKKLYRFTFYKNLSSVHIIIFSIIEKITKLIVSPFVSPASDSSTLQVPHARLNMKILWNFKFNVR